MDHMKVFRLNCTGAKQRNVPFTLTCFRNLWLITMNSLPDRRWESDVWKILIGTVPSYITWLCFARREESTATTRGRSETHLAPLRLSPPAMDCSEYKHSGCNFFPANVASLSVQDQVFLPHLVNLISFSQPSLPVCILCYRGYHSHWQLLIPLLLSLYCSSSVLSTSWRWYF